MRPIPTCPLLGNVATGSDDGRHVTGAEANWWERVRRLGTSPSRGQTPALCTGHPFPMRFMATPFSFTLRASLLGLAFVVAGCAEEATPPLAAPADAVADQDASGSADTAAETPADTAAEPVHEPFTQARFDELQRENALVLVDVWAPWCPTCAQQQPLIAAYQAAHPEANLRVLRVDFDSQKDVVTQFDAPRQSTLILYKGTEREWFSVAETRQDALFAALDAAAPAGTPSAQ